MKQKLRAPWGAPLRASMQGCDELVEVPPMPPGYLFTVVQGRGWRSYGWVVRHEDGSVDIRSGIADPKQASLNAYAHALELERKT